jgi:hypothetical protein
MRDPLGAALMEWERVKLRIADIEARLAEMGEPDFVWNGDRIREHDALEEELADLIAERGNLERLPRLK